MESDTYPDLEPQPDRDQGFGVGNTYAFRPRKVQAIQWAGTYGELEEMREFVRIYSNHTADLVWDEVEGAMKSDPAEGVAIHRHSQNAYPGVEYIYPGSWLVTHPDIVHIIYIINNQGFRENYRLVN